jgi:hypothetical protein
MHNVQYTEKIKKIEEQHGIVPSFSKTIGAKQALIISHHTAKKGIFVEI